MITYYEQDATYVGQHSMTLTVSLDSYPTSSIAFIFEITITCPVQYIAADLVTSIEAIVDYDLGVAQKVEVQLPEFEFEPANCFNVNGYLVEDELGATPNYVSVSISSGMLAI